MLRLIGVGNVQSSPTATRKSKQSLRKNNNSNKNGGIRPNPKNIVNSHRNSFYRFSAVLQKQGLTKQFSRLIQLLEFTVTDVVEAIDDIKPNAASGPDEIPVMLLENCKEPLAEPILRIWLASLASGAVPSFYKISHLFHLHKKDSKALPYNYRPISLTSHIIKIYERVMTQKLVDYMERCQAPAKRPP